MCQEVGLGLSTRQTVVVVIVVVVVVVAMVMVVTTVMRAFVVIRRPQRPRAGERELHTEHRKQDPTIQ